MNSRIRIKSAKQSAFTLVELLVVIAIVMTLAALSLIGANRYIENGRKVKTLSQQLAVAFALMPLTAVDHTWLWQALLWLAVLLTILSGVQYAVRAIRPTKAG